MEMPEEAKVLEILLNKSVDGAYQIADLEKPDNLAILTKIATKEAKDVKEAKKLVKQEKIAELHKKVDAASDVSEAKEREIETGQLWRLGKHLLYCGDSSSEDFQELARKAELSLAFADPPYNAGVDEWDINFEWRHDYLAEIAPIVAVTPGISAIKDFMRVTEMPYKWSMAYWLDNGMARGPLGFGKWIYAALFSNGSIYRNKPDFDRVSVSTNEWDGDGEFDHKGRKPLSMMLHLIETLTEEDDIILDPFLGTGTTLAVCEQSKRVCVGAEINPEYCKGIIRRWEKLSGARAEEVTNGVDAFFS
jgi:ParB family chromosome partitioning protein